MCTLGGINSRSASLIPIKAKFCENEVLDFDGSSASSLLEAAATKSLSGSGAGSAASKWLMSSGPLSSGTMGAELVSRKFSQITP